MPKFGSIEMVFGEMWEDFSRDDFDREWRGLRKYEQVDSTGLQRRMMIRPYDLGNRMYAAPVETWCTASLQLPCNLSR